MRFVGKVLFVVLACCLPIFASHGQMRPRVVHTPVTMADEGKPLDIEAYLEGDIPLTAITEAKIWFKLRDQDAYDFEEMYYSSGQFSGQIKSRYMVSKGLDYFIEIITDDGTSYTFPATDPVTEPLQVNVRSIEVGEPEEPVILISPTPFSEVEGRLLIAVGFNQSAMSIDPGKIRLRINGRDRTREADISEELLVVVIPRLRNKGRQRLDIDYMGDTGLENLGSWSFTWVPEGEASFKLSEYLSANLTSEGRHQRFNGEADNIFRENFNIRLLAGNFTMSATGRLTSEEQGTLQPQHRYLVTAGWPSFRIRYGDIKPRYNELILWGRRVRGASLDMRAGFTRVQAIYGDMSRPLNSNILAIIPDTTATPTAYDTTYAPGTYRRWLGAARVSFGNPNAFVVGFTTMKAKDDMESIDYGERPRDNLVTGMDMEMYLDRRRITLTGQVALSLYNDNIAEPTLKDAEQFSSIIWINQYFDPLPADTSADPQKLIGSIVGNALSYKGRLRIRYFNNDFQTGYRLINRSFRTMGNPTLINDKGGYFVQDRLRLFKSRLYLEGGIEHFSDNVTGKGDITNTNDLLYGSVSIYTGEKLPDLTVGYRNMLNTNDGTFYDYAPDPSQPTLLDTIDTRKENETNVYNVSLTQRMRMFDTQNQFTVAYTTSDRADLYNSLGAANNVTMSFGVRTRYDFPLMTNVNYSNTEQQSIGGLTNISYDLLSLRGDYFFRNRTLVPFFGPRFTFGSGVNAVVYEDPALNIDPANYPDPADYDADVALIRKSTIRSMIVDFTKVDWMAGARWDVAKNHQIVLDLSYTMYSEKGQWEYWNGNRFSITEELVDNDGVPVSQPTVIDRNDIIALISYQVRF